MYHQFLKNYVNKSSEINKTYQSIDYEKRLKNVSFDLFNDETT